MPGLQAGAAEEQARPRRLGPREGVLWLARVVFPHVWESSMRPEGGRQGPGGVSCQTGDWKGVGGFGSPGSTGGKSRVGETMETSKENHISAIR